MVLVTGAAGFIGYHIVRRLLCEGHEVLGLDCINDYYDVRLKYGRLAQLGIERAEIADGRIVKSSLFPAFRFVKMALEERDLLWNLFREERFDRVINLAAQAGVRYSLENPYAYIDSNIVGFVNLLECCRRYPVRHLLYASSSSVYGGNTKVPFSETDRVDDPVSLYAATKKAGELMAHVYAELYKVPSTGLRFFTVYGPWGRPDMAPMLFTKAILAGAPIKVFNNGDLSRDFTYIDDIIEGVVRIFAKTPEGEVPTDIYNIGCGHPMPLMEFIRTLEDVLGRKAQMTMLPMQKGDVYTTYADTTKLQQAVGYHPGTTLKEGISRFIEWYKEFTGCVL